MSEETKRRKPNDYLTISTRIGCWVFETEADTGTMAYSVAAYATADDADSEEDPVARVRMPREDFLAMLLIAEKSLMQ